jgi:uncharacterized protein
MESTSLIDRLNQRPGRTGTLVMLVLMIGWGFAALVGAEDAQTKSSVADVSAEMREKVADLSKSAGQGNPDARFALGMMYLRGSGIVKDFSEAAKSLRLAAEHGHVKAQYEMGLLCLTGDGVAKDYTAAAGWLRMAAEHGLADAQFCLGLLLRAGDGLPKDPDEAAKWLRMAAEQDHRPAKYALERLFENSLSADPAAAPSVPQVVATMAVPLTTPPAGSPKESGKRLTRLFKLAEKGDADAQYELGRTYATGDGVTMDYGETLKWFRKAARQGHKEAKRQLLKTVEGLSKLADHGVDGLVKLAAQGDSWVETLLGYRYLEGIGVIKDHGQALKWFRKAAEQSEPLAQYNLGTMYWRGMGVPRDDKEALKWYEKAAEQGEASAQYNLATMYWLGVGVARDEKEAVKWYRKAAEQGSLKARMALLSMGLDVGE